MILSKNDSLVAEMMSQEQQYEDANVSEQTERNEPDSSTKWIGRRMQRGKTREFDNEVAQRQFQLLHSDGELRQRSTLDDKLANHLHRSGSLDSTEGSPAHYRLLQPVDEATDSVEAEDMHGPARKTHKD